MDFSRCFLWLIYDQAPLVLIVHLGTHMIFISNQSVDIRHFTVSFCDFPFILCLFLFFSLGVWVVNLDCELGLVSFEKCQ